MKSFAFFAASAIWPIDDFSGPDPVSYISTRALRVADVGGNAGILRNAGGSEATINFGADGFVDAAAIATHKGAGGAGWKRLYDPIGGTVLSQTTAAAMPQCRTNGWGLQVVGFEYGMKGGGLGNAAKKWSASGGPSLTSAGMTFVALYQTRDYTHSTDAPGTGNPLNLGPLRWSTTGGIQHYFEGAKPSISAHARTRILRTPATHASPNGWRAGNGTPSFYSMRLAGAGGAIFDIDGVRGTSAGTATYAGTIDWLGANSFDSQTTENSDLLCGLWFNTSLSDAQVSEIRTLLLRAFGFEPPTLKVLMLGDSINAGHDETHFYDEREKSPICEYAVFKNWRNVRVVNAAISSNTLARQLVWNPYLVNTEAQFLSGDAGAAMRVVIAHGSNDLTSTSDAADVIYGRIEALCAGYKTTFGSAVQIAVATIPPRSDLTGDGETRRIALNNLILDNVSINGGAICEAVIPVHAQNWLPGGVWTVNYQGSTTFVHPNANGRALWRAAFDAAMPTNSGGSTPSVWQWPHQSL